MSDEIRKFTKGDIASHPNPNCLWVRLVTYQDAAEEIERLEAENKRLEKQVAFLGEKTLDLALELDAVNTKLRTALEDKE